MPKFTKAERQYIKGIVHNYSLQKWSDQDIVDYLHNEKKIDITRRMVNQVRNQVEQQAEAWYLELKQSRYLYLAHFKERIDTLYSVEKSLWEIANDKDNQVVDRRGALAEIHHTEKTLSALYDVSRYLSATQLTGIKTEEKDEDNCYGEGCRCSTTSMDSRTHSLCNYCFTKWCHSTYNQDWCPNADCSNGLKGNDFHPYDEYNVWLQCNACEQWFKKQEILDIHKQTCNPNTIHVEAEAPEWVETKPVSIPKEQPQSEEKVANLASIQNDYIEKQPGGQFAQVDEGPKEGDVIGPKWSPAEAYKALKKSKAGSNTETTTTSF